MFRALRSAYNKAVNTNCARKSDYPLISKFDVTTQERAIAKTEMLKFTEAFQPIGQKKYAELSKDIFIFCYLCGGINFTDIANLARENIVNGRLHYIRQITGKSIKIGILLLLKPKTVLPGLVLHLLSIKFSVCISFL